jgi:hypothetical protein
VKNRFYDMPDGFLFFVSRFENDREDLVDILLTWAALKPFLSCTEKWHIN